MTRIYCTACGQRLPRTIAAGPTHRTECAAKRGER